MLNINVRANSAPIYIYVCMYIYIYGPSWNEVFKPKPQTLHRQPLNLVSPNPKMNVPLASPNSPSTQIVCTLALQLHWAQSIYYLCTWILLNPKRGALEGDDCSSHSGTREGERSHGSEAPGRRGNPPSSRTREPCGEMEAIPETLGGA